ncbi:hypothetical protein [Geodermatophilus africanus]|uniref:hypothetical protein n=1 Tax=Geodermatophilus africanus TaxID=1137993 RepID=UPI001FCDDA3A|nr:hypothetical protein [Geodermatophilus africanus]
MKVKVDPVISLIIGSLYLGLATGVGFTATLTAIADHDLLLPVRGWARSPHRRHVDATPWHRSGAAGGPARVDTVGARPGSPPPARAGCPHPGHGALRPASPGRRPIAGVRAADPRCGHARPTSVAPPGGSPRLPRRAARRAASAPAFARDARSGVALQDPSATGRGASSRSWRCPVASEGIRRRRTGGAGPRR